MNTFWLKIAGVVILVVGVIVVISVLRGDKSTTAPELPQRTIYDQWQEDDQRLRAGPEPTSPPQPTPTVQPGVEPQAVEPSQPVAPRQPQFEKLSPEEEIEAERKWEWVVNQRKMARLPVMTPKQMVDTCREIIRRWPKSKYAFLSKGALADLPERYHKMYNITKEEMDVSNFYP